MIRDDESRGRKEGRKERQDDIDASQFNSDSMLKPLLPVALSPTPSTHGVRCPPVITCDRSSEEEPVCFKTDQI